MPYSHIQLALSGILPSDPISSWSWHTSIALLVEPDHLWPTQKQLADTLRVLASRMDPLEPSASPSSTQANLTETTGERRKSLVLCTQCGKYCANSP